MKQHPKVRATDFERRPRSDFGYVMVLYKLSYYRYYYYYYSNI